jgi:hypothetical protein
MKIIHLKYTNKRAGFGNIYHRKSPKVYKGFMPDKFKQYLSEKVLLRKQNNPIIASYKGKDIISVKPINPEIYPEESLLFQFINLFNHHLKKDIVWKSNLPLLRNNNVFKDFTYNIIFSLGIEKDYEDGTIYCITIKHPKESFDGNIVKEVLSGRIKRMKGELKRVRKRKKRDENGNILRDKNGKKVIEKEIIDVDPYENIPRFIYIKEDKQNER